MLHYRYKPIFVIPYLGKNIQYDGWALLANFDYLVEQEPHRDFSQTKKIADV
jgi:hypothetical protein